MPGTAQAVCRAQEGARRHGTSPGAGGEAGDAGTAATANGGAASDAPTAAPPAAALGAGADVGTPAVARPPPAGYTRPKCYAWADLLERTFQIDVLACPGCGGRLRLIATIGHRAVIDKILRYLGLPGETVEPAPPRHPAWLQGFEVPIAATEWPG